MCVFLKNEPNSSLNLDSTFKEAEFKHNKVFMYKFMSMRLDLSIYNIILYVYIMYMYKNIFI